MQRGLTFGLLAGTFLCLATQGAFAQPSAIKRAEVTKGDTKTVYYTLGEGPRIVLIPSATRGADDFFELAELLAPSGLRIILPEPRGIGGSTGPAEKITLHDLAADVANVLQAEGGQPAFVAGHAYGNWVARTLATDHPALVKAAGVIAASAKGAIPEHLLKAVAGSSDMKLSEEERMKWLKTGFFVRDEDARKWLHGWTASARPLQRMASGAISQDVFWKAGGKPMLELQAELDPFMPAERRGDLRAEVGPQLKTVLIPNASHALVPEQPCAVAKAIVDYVREIGLAPEAKPVACK